MTESQNFTIKNDDGFTLLEILVALVLVTFIMALVTGDNFSSRKNLDEVLERFESAIRFSTDEAILRNSIVRLHINFDKTPQEFVVEYGPNGRFVIPKRVVAGPTGDKEEDQKNNKEFDQLFSPVPEFEEISREILPDIQILGASTALSSQLLALGTLSIFFYPSGERDPALIIFGTDDEVATLQVEPFVKTINREYRKLTDLERKDLDDSHLKIVSEIYQKWQGKE